MKELNCEQLFDDNSKVNSADDKIFENTVFIDFADNPLKLQKNAREKGVDTVMFECENGATLILQKDCKTEKIIGIEIFK